jgi:ABC-type sugar transport system ATPase subunit
MPYKKWYVQKNGADKLNNPNNAQTILKVENLTKRFTGITANKNINLEFKAGEIHAIIGENGAGKSTFCKMLTGIYKPDDGDITFLGKKVQFNTPAESRNAGISMVYQERNVIGYLNGAENICLGYEPQSGIFLDKKKVITRAEEIRERLGIDVPLNIPVEKLGAGAQQIIEIMRAFYINPKLLILDEPTASLSQGEVEPFLADLKKIRDQLGISIIFISHKIDEVFKVADRVTVFTDGESVFSKNIDETCQDDCVGAMIKKGKITPIVVTEKDTDQLEKVLEVESLTYDGAKHDLKFNTRLGEVVGFYGLVGSGRTEAMEAIFGVRPADERSFIFANQKVSKGKSFDMIKSGMIMTPERRSNGLFLGLNVLDNVCNLFLDKLSSRIGFIRFNESRHFAKRILEKSAVKYSSLSQNITGLSGGNMQRVIIGRSTEVENLKLLVLDEPTAGLDLGAKQEVYIKIRKLADEDQKSIIFISSELDELLAVCDRIYVFYAGNITKEFKRKSFNKVDILSAAIGGSRENGLAISTN